MGFQNDFLWGAATAAPQIEGGWNADGRTPSVWDILPAEQIKNEDSPKSGCEHYSHWREDVTLMQQIGLKAYRFSISWSRVIPERGKVNEKGLQFYKNLVSSLRAAGIEPMVTLFHWDLPAWLVKDQGWDGETIVEDFVFYVKTVVDALSDQVTWWLTFNEPQNFATDVTNSLWEHDIKRATRNILLAHGKAAQEIRKRAKTPPKIGMAIMGMCVAPVDGAIDEEAAYEMTFSDLAGAMGMSWWLDPVILGKIPKPLLDTLSDKDISEICQKLDFFAGNVYFAGNYYKRPGRPNPLRYEGYPTSSANMPIVPECMHWFPKFCYRRYGLPILITENGFSNIDFVMSDGKVHDPQRADFIRRYLLELRRAAEENIPVIGYLYWSLLDNFEWTSGYDPRFGLVYVDYKTKKRTVKDSAMFYKEVIESNGECL